MPNFKRNCALILLFVFSLFHLGIAQRLFIAVPQPSSGCCVSECGCPPSSCQCEHSEGSGEAGIVFEAPECSLVKTTVNGAFALMYFLPSYALNLDDVVVLTAYVPALMSVPDSNFVFSLERPPRFS